MPKKNKDKEKEKVVYYDDGSTIADMDGIKKSNPLSKRSSSTLKEKFKTFFQAFKMMLIPTAIALLVLLILYIIFMLIGTYAS